MWGYVTKYTTFMHQEFNCLEDDCEAELDELFETKESLNTEKCCVFRKHLTNSLLKLETLSTNELLSFSRFFGILRGILLFK